MVGSPFRRAHLHLTAVKPVPGYASHAHFVRNPSPGVLWGGRRISMDKVFVFTVVSGIADLDVIEVYSKPEDAIERFMSFLDENFEEQFDEDDFKHALWDVDNPQMYEKGDDDTVEVMTVEIDAGNELDIPY
jgi:hypothetical protein